MSEATIYRNRAWFECDWFGNAHVFVQSEAPDSAPVLVCTVFYDYGFADNTTKRSIARAVASRYDSRPIQEHDWTPPKETSDE